MQHDFITKKYNFSLGPGPPREMDPGHQIKILFDMFYIYYYSACIKKIRQNIN